MDKLCEGGNAMKLAMNIPGSRPRRRGCFLLAPQFWGSCAITGFFLMMMFLLWRREVGRNIGMRKLGLSPEQLTVTWADYDQYMYILRDGEKIGGSVMRVSRVPEQDQPGKIGYDLVSRSRLNLKVAGQDVAAATDIFVHLNELFELDTFQGLAKTMGQEVRVDAFSEGKTLYYRCKLPPFLLAEEDRAKGAIISKTELEERVMLADAIMPLITSPENLRVGKKWSAVASNPLAAQFNLVVNVEVEALETIELDGEKIEAFRVKEEAGEMKTTTWYDDKGKALRSDPGNRLLMERVPDADVVKFYEQFGLMPNFDDMKVIKGEIKANATEMNESLVDRLTKALPSGGAEF